MIRNWQEDWNWVTNVNHTPTETEIIAAYWLKEVKRLREQVAKLHCDHQNEKTMRIQLAADANKQQRRAIEAEAYAAGLEAVIMQDEAYKEGMLMAQAQTMR